MVHRGVQYTIRQGIERDQWTVVVHLPSGKTVEKPTRDSRHAAETAARDIIDKWLEKKYQEQTATQDTQPIATGESE
jgi:DNA-binding cell septation regulator SpoVG